MNSRSGVRQIGRIVNLHSSKREGVERRRSGCLDGSHYSKSLNLEWFFMDVVFLRGCFIGFEH